MSAREKHLIVGTILASTGGFLYIVFTLNKILPFWQFGMLSGVAMVAFSALGYTEKQNHHLSGLL
jgi:hypothetical protein